MREHINILDILTWDRLARLKRWCLMRQDGGFNGRPGKPSDTCYSFWIGATLELLEFLNFSDAERNKKFILNTQDTLVGGLAKFDNTRPDPLHTYLGKREIIHVAALFHNIICRCLEYKNICLIKSNLTSGIHFK